MRYIFLSLFAVWATTYAMMYEPEPQGYTQAERTGMGRLVERSVVPQACGDDWLCLLAWAGEHGGKRKKHE
jgi:hypothetical protein